MPNSLISAGDVSSAYTLPLDGVANNLRYSDQVALQRQQQRQALEEKKHAEDFKKTQLLEHAFEGTEIGTGTPYDQIGTKLAGDAKGKLISFMNDNPGASYSDLWAQATEATRPLLAGISEAKKAQTLIDHEVERANKEYPHIDPSLLKAYYQKQAFRDKDGNVLSLPNYNFYGNELSTSEGRARFANPVATAQGVQKELSDGFKPEEYAYADKSVPGAVLRGKTRAYLSPTGQVLSEPLSWEGAAPDQGAVGVPDALLQRLKAKPIFSDALEMEKQRIRSEYGDKLKGAPDSAIERIAAHHLVSNYGSRDGVEMAKPDYKVADHQNKLQHQSFQESVAARNLALHAKSVELAGINTGIRMDTAQKKKSAELETVPNQMYLARMNPQGQPPAMQTAIKHAQMLENNNREFMRITGMDRPVPVVNLSKWHGVQLFEPGTKNPVVLKLANLGGKVGEVLYQYPMKYNKLKQKWEEDHTNTKVFGSTIKDDGVRSFKKPVADVLQQFDRQWNKGIKGDNENMLESALPGYTEPPPDLPSTEED